MSLFIAMQCIAQWRKQEIKEIKVCKKCPKVNPYCDVIFDPIMFKPFFQCFVTFLCG